MPRKESVMKEQWHKRKLLRIIYTVSGIFYGAGLIYIFFLARRRWRPLTKRTLNIIPFRDKIYYLHIYAIRLNPQNLEFYKDLVGNFLLFVPFPFLIFYFFHVRNYGKLLLISAATSLAVEIIQYIFNIGVADIDDLILNSIGASAGIFILYALSRLRQNRPSVTDNNISYVQ
jgi:glycopeptide antibiotics resistance protein